MPMQTRKNFETAQSAAEHNLQGGNVLVPGEPVAPMADIDANKIDPTKNNVGDIGHKDGNAASKGLTDGAPAPKVGLPVN
jgi:hypothetical protein